MADVTIDAPARRIGDASVVATARDIGIVALAGEQAGGGAADAGDDGRLCHAAPPVRPRDRQFSSDQAHGRRPAARKRIRHTSAARNAAQALAETARDDADAALALAGFACADAFVKCAADGIQMHGGIAFTWTHPAHLYLRRARSGAQLFGASDAWRERYIRALETNEA